INEYTVIFKDHDGREIKTELVAYGTGASAPEAPTREGYDFVGWDQAFTNITEAIVVTATYQISQYTVTFDTQGGNVIQEITVEYLTTINLVKPAKENSVFLGWSDGDKLYENTYQVKDHVVLIATWTDAVNYQIIFDTAGGDLIEPITLLTHDYVTTLPDATRTDYVFMGWTYLGHVIELPFRYTYGQDITLIAQWKDLSDIVEFSIENNEAFINKYIGNEETLVLPDTIGGYPVTKIQAESFKGNTTLKSIKLGQYVVEVGNEAFNNMSNLENIEFSNATQTFGTSVFRYSNKLVNITISSEVSNELSYYFGNDINFIPTSLQTITYAIGGSFIDKTLTQGNMREVGLVLANDTISIVSQQFQNSSITSIVIPNSVTSIGYWAFDGANSLKSIVIPNSVTSIGSMTFYEAESLTIYAEVSSQPSGWDSSWNFSNRPVIWGYLETINDGSVAYALSSNGNAYVLELIENPTTTEIIIPRSINGYVVTDIIIDAFRNSSITSIVIPSSVTSIGYWAFHNTGSLTIYAETSSQPLGWDSSWNVSNVSVIWGYLETINDDSVAYALSSNGNAYVLGLIENPITTEIIIPRSINGHVVTDIINGSFRDSSIISIVIPNSVKSIGGAAFYGASSLTTVTFEENSELTSIGHYSFYNARSLTSIVIPNSVTSIGYGAFFGSFRLTIYAEVSSKPLGWESAWNLLSRPVYWNGQWSYDDNGNPKAN
ncbi:leucine-rich repeat protein, partial [Acholeplasma laidlawii]|uniref:leucine-rich repeat protein n=1 Tax=Acholeplasma laidlawii TaxID=2148 RepID=UPI0018C2865D